MAGPQLERMPSQAAAGPQLVRTASHVTAGSLIARSLEVWWKNLFRFSLVALLVYVPILVLAAFLGISFFRAFERGPGGQAAPEVLSGVWGTFGVLFVLAMFLGLAALAAYTYGTIQHLSGKPVRIGALLGVGARRAIPVFFVGLLVGAAMMGGLILLVVPGVIILCGLYVAIPAVVVERDGIFASLGRSWRLTRGRRLAIFAAGLVFLAINWAASFAAQLVGIALPGQLAAVGVVLSMLVSFVLSSLPAVMPAVAYHDLRVEKEGVATEDLVKVFE